MQPDYEGALQYALERLANELTPALIYHSLAHTRDDVLPAVERLAQKEGIAADDLLLLRTAAAYHDIGFVLVREEHEAAGARIAAEALPCFGYSPAQIEQVQCMIMATRLPQSPQTSLEEIVADADLDVLGRTDFVRRNHDLRTETAAFGTELSDVAWCYNQLHFLKSHHYWTVSAQRLRDSGKQKNIDRLAKRVSEPDCVHERSCATDTG